MFAHVGPLHQAARMNPRTAAVWTGDPTRLDAIGMATCEPVEVLLTAPVLGQPARAPHGDNANSNQVREKGFD
jgi:hypothetical protein